MNREEVEAKVSDREALAAAVEYVNRSGSVNYPEWVRVLRQAGDERLAQLPEKCGTCINKAVPGFVALGQTCPNCHGSGKVYPAELVERIAQHFAAALMPYVGEKKAGELVRVANAHAVAVLDALNGETE